MGDELTERQRELHTQFTRVLAHHEYRDSRAHTRVTVGRVEFPRAVDTFHDDIVVRLVAAPGKLTRLPVPGLVDRAVTTSKLSK